MTQAAINYFAVFALDIDGVFADTLHRHIRFDHPNAQDPRITKFMLDHPELFQGKAQGLGKHDVQGIMVESLILIAEFIQKTNSCMVLVSSWIYEPNTYKHIELLIRELTGIEYDKPFMVGQIRSGGGGVGREQNFLHWCKTNLDPSHVMSVAAIDDSGARHFPIFDKINQLIAPIGRCGFTPDEYIIACRKIHYHCDQWSDWLTKYGHKWVDNSDEPKLTREQFWDILHNSNGETIEANIAKTLNGE